MIELKYFVIFYWSITIVGTNIHDVAMCESQQGEQRLPVLVVAAELAILVEGEGVVVKTLIPNRVPNPMFPGDNVSDKVGDVFCDVCLL